jgi:hypothetical protein
MFRIGGQEVGDSGEASRRKRPRIEEGSFLKDFLKYTV